MADGKPSTRWPSREQFLGFGLVACRGEDCRVLINPSISNSPRYCRRCSEQWGPRRR